MPYSHQWRRFPALDRAGFANVVEDVKLIFKKAEELGIRLAGPTGYGKPQVDCATIAFNGDANCRHRFVDYGDPWPTDTAEGVNKNNADTDEPYADEPYWSGEYLTTRVCHGGRCAQKPFVVDRVFMVKHWTRIEFGKGYYCWCETLFKPYDLIVTAVLIRLKEHLYEEIFVNSDGREKGFEDAKRLCRELFGWSDHFELEHRQSEDV